MISDSAISVTSTVPSSSVAKEDPDLKKEGQSDANLRKQLRITMRPVVLFPY